MAYSGLSEFRMRGSAALAKGPVALILAEDGVELAGTVAHHRKAGFRSIVLFAPGDLAVPEGIEDFTTLVRCDTLADGAASHIVNAVIEAAPEGTWLYYCFNAEYLFYPFCESRTVGELLAFHAEERRSAMLTYVIDLYADDLSTAPNAVSVEAAYLDQSGYYAAARRDPAQNFHPVERQLDFYGGLRWRFEEHVAPVRRRIDRIALFRTCRGLKLGATHTFNVAEYNTYACPWHNNLTAAICSFRAAKALRSNPASRHAISTFRWHNSVRFDWRSQQLLDLGLMEPGQWF